MRFTPQHVVEQQAMTLAMVAGELARRANGDQ
jgi:hypothetical protein